MNGKWHYVDELSIIIDPKFRSLGNYFKEHALTFFTEENLNFCILEITTLKYRTSLGEIFIYSHLDDTRAQTAINTYKNIVKKIESKYKNPLANYKDWYKKRTHIFIGNNPGGSFRRSEDDSFTWNLDGEPQKEEKVRPKDPFIETGLEKKFIEEYLNQYIELLESELGFLKFEHYAVIVKPLALPHRGKAIPIGNAYLHFATNAPINVDQCTKFINEFIAIYLKEKGGQVVVELIDEINKGFKELPKYIPSLIAKSSEEPHGKILIETIENLFLSPSKEFENLHQKSMQLLSAELIDCFFEKGKFDKAKIDRKKVNDYPFLSALLDRKDLRPENILKAGININELILDLFLYRQLILVLLICLKLTGGEVYHFINKRSFDYNWYLSKNTGYKFFLDKFLISIKDSLMSKVLDSDRSTILKQASEMEKEFIKEFGSLINSR